MNEFNVNTPEEWKTGLYMKLEKSKNTGFRPIAVLVACLAVIMCLSGTAFAVSAVKAPEYFGSLFLGQSETADEMYSEKNIIFESSRDDLTLTCKGIAGDSFDVYMLFELVSTGETVFSTDNTYYFNVFDHKIPFSDFSRSINFGVTDEKTVQIEICFSGLEGDNFVGKDIEMHIEGIEFVKTGSVTASTSVIECEFNGKIKVDYVNTLNKLKRTSDVLISEGVTFVPEKAEISNLNLDFHLSVSAGEEIYINTDPEKLVAGILTLNYKDGTSESLNIKMPPEKDTDTFFSTIGKFADELHLQLHFQKPVKAGAVESVEINSVKLFIAK